jgi:CheY-like chemotaxis protein
MGEIMTGTKTILLADDDDNDAAMLKLLFGRLSLEEDFHRASDGAQAIRYLSGEGEYADREAYPLPRILLLDLKMPVKTGFEVLAWIRAQAEIKRTVVVILSASHADDDVRRAYDLGANSYLVKPVEMAAMQTLVRFINEYWLELNYTAPET